MKRQNKEENLQIAVSTYLKTQYPNVVFTSESSGLRLPMGLAVKAKKQRSKHKLPDMIILKSNSIYNGLILELKKGYSEIHKKDGSYRQTEHVQEQLKTLNLLTKQKYYALFACGFDECKKIIDSYVSPCYNTNSKHTKNRRFYHG